MVFSHKGASSHWERSGLPVPPLLSIQKKQLRSFCPCVCFGIFANQLSPRWHQLSWTVHIIRAQQCYQRTEPTVKKKKRKGGGRFHEHSQQKQVFFFSGGSRVNDSKGATPKQTSSSEELLAGLRSPRGGGSRFSVCSAGL